MTLPVVRRPSLPSGHYVPGFSSVQKPLHIDPEVEIYLLEGESKLILVHIRNECEPASVASERLLKWWSLLGGERVTVRAVLDNPDALQAVLQVRGEWLGAEEWRNVAVPEENEIVAFFAGLCDASALALVQSVQPSFEPSLVWWNESSGESVAPIYVGPNVVDEGGLVRDAALLTYWWASRINLREATGPVAPLSKWVKTVGPLISEVLGRCLASGTDRVQSLAEVRRCIDGNDTGLSRRREGNARGNESVTDKGLAAVAGMRDLRSLLQREVVDPMRDPEPFKKYGLSTPNGILLYGPPGCGKTWIARKLAEEVGHFFVEIIPSEIASPYIHQSVLRIRELFELAAQHAPSIIFIDEFEALAPSRADLGGSQQYKSEEVNEFLAHLNECSEKKIFVIAATNEPQKIDPAIRRTGRLDKIIYVGPPDAEARVEMLRMHLAARPVSTNVDYVGIAATLNGYSASDIKFLVDQAARAAMEEGVEISGDILRAASARVPASVTAEDEMRFQSFVTRG